MTGRKEKKVENTKRHIRDITRQIIKELREKEDLTQTELAERVGINRSLISQYESGEREPSLLSLVKLADYANVTVDFLLGRESAVKYTLTKTEEQVVKVWRRISPGYELTIKKNEHNEKLGNHDQIAPDQIQVKLDVKLNYDSLSDDGIGNKLEEK
ncbi:MAG: helix-turn-helix transcriptional regulator [Candidatus Schekmanbacteria bacterium]|nr:helix-turn-helix transcriptional regulator [Candidatus Schekmanbacteria bacterium]